LRSSYFCIWSGDGFQPERAGAGWGSGIQHAILQAECYVTTPADCGKTESCAVAYNSVPREGFRADQFNASAADDKTLRTRHGAFISDAHKTAHPDRCSKAVVVAGRCDGTRVLNLPTVTGSVAYEGFGKICACAAAQVQVVGTRDANQ